MQTSSKEGTARLQQSESKPMNGMNAARSTFLFHASLLVLTLLLCVNASVLSHIQPVVSLAEKFSDVCQITNFFLMCFFWMVDIVTNRHLTTPICSVAFVSVFALQTFCYVTVAKSAFTAICLPAVVLLISIGCLWRSTAYTIPLISKVLIALLVSWNLLTLVSACVLYFSIDISNVSLIALIIGGAAFLLSVLLIARRTVAVPLTISLILYLLWGELFKVHFEVAAFALALSMFMIWCALISIVRLTKPAW